MNIRVFYNESGKTFEDVMECFLTELYDSFNTESVKNMAKYGLKLC